MMRLSVILLVIMTITVSSCTSNRNFTSKSFEESEETVAEQSVETPSHEALFVYSNQSNLPNRIVLTLASEPLLLPSGYVRLVGVVSGGKPVACLEIGGRGLAMGEGEAIDGYRVSGINNDNVVLERGK